MLHGQRKLTREALAFAEATYSVTGAAVTLVTAGARDTYSIPGVGAGKVSLKGSTQRGNTGKTVTHESNADDDNDVMMMIQIQIQIRQWKQVATQMSTALQGELAPRKPLISRPRSRGHEARPHSVLVPSASTLTRDTAASAPPFHTQTKKSVMIQVLQARVRNSLVLNTNNEYPPEVAEVHLECHPCSNQFHSKSW